MSNEVDLLQEKVLTDDWNPLHLAVYYKQTAIVKYYLEEVKINFRLSLMGPMSVLL
jgi:ankyrin repeat protein